MPQRNAEVVQSTSNTHSEIRKTFLGVAKNVLHNATALDTGDNMFYPDTHTGNQAIEKLISDPKLFAFWFFSWVAT